MADILSTLFGGSSGKSVSTPKDVTPPEFTSLRGGLADWLKSALSGTTPGITAPTGPLVAPVSDQFNQLSQQAGAAASNTNLLNTAGTALTGILNQGPGNNPYLEQMISAATRPLTDAFQNTVVPQLLSRFTQGGQQVQGSGSSAFAAEGRKASSDLLRQIGDTTANIAGNAYQSDQANKVAAAGQAAGLSSAEMSQLTSGLQATLLPQLVSDLGVQRGLEQYNTNLNALLQVLQVAGGLAQPHVANAAKFNQSQSSGVVPALFG